MSVKFWKSTRNPAQKKKQAQKYARREVGMQCRRMRSMSHGERNSPVPVSQVAKYMKPLRRRRCSRETQRSHIRSKALPGCTCSRQCRLHQAGNETIDAHTSLHLAPMRACAHLPSLLVGACREHVGGVIVVIIASHRIAVQCRCDCGVVCHLPTDPMENGPCRSR